MTTQEMKPGKAGQGDHREQQGLETTNGSWGSLLQGCVPAQGSGLTVLRGSQEKLQIWSFVRNLSDTGKAKQNSRVGGHGRQPAELQTPSCAMRTQVQKQFH